MKILVQDYLEQNLVNIIGGCCGTTPEHISLIADLARKFSPREPKTFSNV
jgi:5-methyltetrahydrofolate--homocysteine methyltransferase